MDGAEIHESVLTLLALDRAGVKTICTAPDKMQFNTMDHIKAVQVEHGNRNVLLESSRIARGDIIPLTKLDLSKIDAVIFPGGFGVAKNLCTFGIDGPNCQIDPDIKKIILDTLASQKPLGVICIAPALAAKATQNSPYKITITIGNDPVTAKAVETLGAVHKNCPVDDIVVDAKNKIVSTPAYMLGPSVYPVSKGIDKLVDKIISMI